MYRGWPIFLVLVLFPAIVGARPVSYTGAWTVDSFNDGAQSVLQAHYSPTARYALGVRSEYLRGDENWVHSLTYNRLLQRWNGEDSQANLFLQTSLGVAEQAGDIDPAAGIGLAADWETRRLYFAYENRYLWAGDVEEAFTHKARVGVAPYVGEYEDVHTWLMLQVDHRPTGQEHFTVTPFVRLFTQDVLGEVGVSNHKDLLLNVTLQF